MIDFGVKTMRYVKHEKEYVFSVDGGDEYVLKISRPEFDIVSIPEIVVEGKVDYDIVFDGEYYVVKFHNNGKRKRSVKVKVEVYGLKVWR